jgi:hypothetical protein
MTGVNLQLEPQALEPMILLVVAETFRTLDAEWVRLVMVL